MSTGDRKRTVEPDPRVLLLLPSTSYKAHDFLEAARALGVEVTVGSDQRQALESLTPGGSLALEFGDLDAAVADIESFAEDYPLRAVVGTDDETAVLAALAARRLGLPHNPPEAVAATRDKHALRKALSAAGLPSPGFRLVPLDADPSAIAAKIPYPCVLKPTYLSASRGVLRADDPGSFVAAFERVRAILEDPATREAAAGAADAARGILVEDYIPGEEYALEAILEDGDLRMLALFDKPDPLTGPTFEETLYVTPSRAPAKLQRDIRHRVKRAATELGLVTGPLHGEVRVADGEVFVIDIAARTIGGLCSRSLRFGTGLSLEEVVLRHALGGDWKHEREAAAAGVMMLPVERAGSLRRVGGLEEARAVPGVVEVRITVPWGQEVAPLPEGDRYLGFVFARGDEPAEVEEALRQAYERLEIEIG